MRIAMIVSRFPKLSETFILNQITGLLDAGHHVDIYAATSDTSGRVHPEVEQRELLSRTHYLNIPSHIGSRLRAAVHEIPAILSRGPGTLLGALNVPRHGRKALSLALLFSASAFARRDPYDIVHAQFGHLGPRAAALLDIGATSGSLVVSFRGSDLTPLEATHEYPRMFPKTQLVLPVCKAFSEDLQARGCDPEKIHVLHSGIQVAVFPFRPSVRREGEPTRLITVGRLEEKKGISYALRAVANVRRSNRPIRYVIVGDGALLEALQKESRSLEIDDVVDFVGAKTHKEIPSILRAAHIFVAPSVKASDGDQEGIPNVLKEAMASGLPVVSTNHSGIPELVDDGISGALVPERDVDTLTSRLIQLIDNPDIWIEMGRAGRHKVEREFASDVVNRRLISLYERAIAGEV